MDAKKEQHIVDSRLCLNEEIGELIGSSNEQYGYEGIKYAIKEMKRMAKIIKKDLKKQQS